MNRRLFIFITMLTLLCSLISGCNNKKETFLGTTPSNATEAVSPTEAAIIIEQTTEPTHEALETAAEIEPIEETEATTATVPTSSNTTPSQTNKDTPKETQPAATQPPATQPPATEMLPLENIGEVEEGTGWG